ncbi:hypothetical protein DPEC_G00296140 [Dallia pectoralis]|uniref:Uncharacterized protein n=1 Tax=Dallia pectoralis TaxID=75939 RepID=A0ACC2FIX5_DALPE|nr:hypothetical protein DPEC_G00296140 [Dallia pectoralis]
MWCQWQESQVPQGHPDLLAIRHLANPAPQVGLVNPVFLARLVRKVNQVQLDFRVPGVCQDLLEAPDLLAFLRLASLDHRVCLGQWDQGGKQVLRDIQESQDHLELESQASQESQVRQENQEHLVGTGHLVPWGCQELRVTLELLELVCPENQVIMVLQVCLVQLVLKVIKAQLEQLVHLVSQDMASPEQMERKEREE